MLYGSAGGYTVKGYINLRLICFCVRIFSWVQDATYLYMYKVCACVCAYIYKCVCMCVYIYRSVFMCVCYSSGV